MKRSAEHLRGLLGTETVAVGAVSDPLGEEANRLREIAAITTDLRRTLDYLDATALRVSRMHSGRFKKPGAARAAANAARVSFECVKQAFGAIDKAQAGGPLSKRYLELARHFAWIAATRAGGALALNGLALRGTRESSRTAKFEALLAKNPDLSVAKVNAMLSVPIDEPTARRIAREIRGSARSRSPRK